MYFRLFFLFFFRLVFSFSFSFSYDACSLSFYNLWADRLLLSIHADTQARQFQTIFNTRTVKHILCIIFKMWIVSAYFVCCENVPNVLNINWRWHMRAECGVCCVLCAMWVRPSNLHLYCQSVFFFHMDIITFFLFFAIEAFAFLDKNYVYHITHTSHITHRTSRIAPNWYNTKQWYTKIQIPYDGCVSEFVSCKKEKIV